MSKDTGRKKRSPQNVVTIVQTSRTDPPPSGPADLESDAATEESVIVTVSGSVDSQQQCLMASPGEVEILAHL